MDLDGFALHHFPFQEHLNGWSSNRKVGVQKKAGEIDLTPIVCWSFTFHGEIPIPILIHGVDSPHISQYLVLVFSPSDIPFKDS